MKNYKGSYSIGNALKNYRKREEITQNTLAEELKISPQYVGILERGEKMPAMDVFIRIAKVTHRSPNELLADILGIYDDGTANKIISEFDNYPNNIKKWLWTC